MLGREIAAQVGQQNVLVVPTDVSNPEQVQRLKDKAYETFGEVRTLAPDCVLSLFSVLFCFWRNFGEIGVLTSEHVLL